MNKIYLALIIVGSLFLSGCFEEDFSRYPSISIAQYTEVDYVNLLSNENTKVVYNSIVILGQQAEGMGGTLSNEKVDRKYLAMKNGEKIWFRLDIWQRGQYGNLIGWA